MAGMPTAGIAAAAPAPDSTRVETRGANAAADTLGEAPSDGAAAAARDSAGVVSGTRGPRIGVGGTRADSARVVKKTGLFDQPRFVMLRSLLVPGWGQLHNRAWIKAGAVAFGEVYLAVNIVQDGRDLETLNANVEAARLAGDLDAERVAVDQYNALLNTYVGRQWLLGALVVYALMDAYVDAHFVGFKVEFEHDPALPPGVTGARISVEKKF
jgi:hypothetical protein